MKKIKNINCTTPARVTPKERYLAIFKLWKYEIKILIINIIFKIIGAAAAAANLLCEFKIAEKKDAKLIKNNNGKVILVKSMEILNFSGSFIKPGAIILINTVINI